MKKKIARARTREELKQIEKERKIRGRQLEKGRKERNEEHNRKQTKIV